MAEKEYKSLEDMKNDELLSDEELEKRIRELEVEIKFCNESDS